MEIIIEEISRGQKLIGRHRFLTDKVNIGRSYQNDIILSDPHICPEHLCLERQGDAWIVHDLDSVNGSFLGDGKQSADQHLVHSGDVLTLGKSQIRILFPNHPVAASVSFSPFEGLIDFMRSPLVLTLSVLLFAFVTGFMFYLNQAAEVNFTQYIVRAVGATLAFALWPGLIALISHLSKNEARIFAQLGISFALFNLMWLSDVLESIVQFNISGNWSITWLITLIPIALAFALFWLNCYIGFHMTERKRLFIAGGLTALMFGGSYLVQMSNEPEFNLRPQYDATILNPVFRLAPSSPVDKFINDSEKLFAKADKHIKEDD